MISFYSIKPWDSKKKFKKFSDILEFDWEKEGVPQETTAEDVKRIKALYSDIDAKNNSNGAS